MPHGEGVRDADEEAQYVDVYVSLLVPLSSAVMLVNDDGVVEGDRDNVGNPDTVAVEEVIPVWLGEDEPDRVRIPDGVGDAEIVVAGDGEGDTLVLAVTVEVNEDVETADSVLLHDPVGLKEDDKLNAPEGEAVELSVYATDREEEAVNTPEVLKLGNSLGETDTVDELWLLEEKNDVALGDSVSPPWLLLAPTLTERVEEEELVNEDIALAVGEEAARKEGEAGWEPLAEIVGVLRSGDDEEVGEGLRVGEEEGHPEEEAEREGEEVPDGELGAVGEAEEH